LEAACRACSRPAWRRDRDRRRSCRKSWRGSTRLVEFRSGGAAVDVGPDQLGVAARAIVFAGHLLNSFVRNSESRRERLFSRDTNKNANKPDGCGEFLRVFSTRHENFSENMESNQPSKLLLLFMFSVWCPWPTIV
jgi:hypothetical protein